MGYKFNLQKVLNYKESLENQKKGQLGDANKKLREEENILASYTDYKYELLARKNTSERISIGELKLFNNKLNQITSSIEEQENLVKNIRLEVEEIKKELIVAMQEKKSFEILKEKDYEEYLKESKRQEEKIIDELVTFKSNTQA